MTFSLYKEGTWYLSLTERDESGGSMVSSMYVPITVVGGVANVYKTSLSGGIASGLVASSKTERCTSPHETCTETLHLALDCTHSARMMN